MYIQYMYRMHTILLFCTIQAWLFCDKSRLYSISNDFIKICRLYPPLSNDFFEKSFQRAFLIMETAASSFLSAQSVDSAQHRRCHTSRSRFNTFTAQWLQSSFADVSLCFTSAVNLTSITTERNMRPVFTHGKQLHRLWIVMVWLMVCG